MFRDEILAGKEVLGAITGFASSDLTEVLAQLGFDYVMMDMEHGPLGPHHLSDQVRAVERMDAVPLARVTDHNPKNILRALDAGVHGIMVPQVDSGETAARYVPQGKRGLAPGHMAGEWGNLGLRRQIEVLNRRTLVIVQVETEEGLENCEEIAAAPGVDVVFVGPADLSQALGVPGQVDHPSVIEARRHVAEAVLSQDKAVGTIASNLQQTEELQKEGHSFFLTGWLGLLKEGFQDRLAPIWDVLNRSHDD